VGLAKFRVVSQAGLDISDAITLVDQVTPVIEYH
jgi:hypothetical protein